MATEIAGWLRRDSSIVNCEGVGELVGRGNGFKGSMCELNGVEV